MGRRNADQPREALGRQQARRAWRRAERLRALVEDAEWLVATGEVWERAHRRLGYTSGERCKRELRAAGRRDLIARLTQDWEYLARIRVEEALLVERFGDLASLEEERPASPQTLMRLLLEVDAANRPEVVGPRDWHGRLLPRAEEAS